MERQHGTALVVHEDDARERAAMDEVVVDALVASHLHTSPTHQFGQQPIEIPNDPRVSAERRTGSRKSAVWVTSSTRRCRPRVGSTPCSSDSSRSCVPRPRGTPRVARRRDRNRTNPLEEHVAHVHEKHVGIAVAGLFQVLTVGRIPPQMRRHAGEIAGHITGQRRQRGRKRIARLDGQADDPMPGEKRQRPGRRLPIDEDHHFAVEGRAAKGRDEGQASLRRIRSRARG